MSSELIGLIIITGFIAPFLPILLWVMLTVAVLTVVWKRKSYTGKGRAASRMNERDDRQVLSYANFTPSNRRIQEWARMMEVKKLGDKLASRFKDLLDRAMQEDFFPRFGDNFIVMMKVNAYQIAIPGTDVPQELWNSLIKRQIDFLICDRWTLDPVLAILLWTGEGIPPQLEELLEDIENWGINSGLTVKEWEQWIATGLLMAAGIHTLLISQDQVNLFLTRPELILETIEPTLAVHLEKKVMKEHTVS